MNVTKMSESALKPGADAVLVLSTAPDEAAARHIAQALLEARVAACVNLLPGAASMYWWQGRIEAASEWLLLIKTVRSRLAALQAVLSEIHPYEVPECVALDIAGGLPEYLQWLAQETAPSLPAENRDPIA